MKMDLVKCCNCGWKGKVDLGREDCPNCKQIGYLMWKNENEPEVEL
jgi:hypothetical protein